MAVKNYQNLLYKDLSYQIQGAAMEIRKNFGSGHKESLYQKLFINQLYDYLRNSKYELGYFINFASPKLYIKRVIFTNDKKPFLYE